MGPPQKDYWDGLRSQPPRKKIWARNVALSPFSNKLDMGWVALSLLSKGLDIGGVGGAVPPPERRNNYGIGGALASPQRNVWAK